MNLTSTKLIMNEMEKKSYQSSPMRFQVFNCVWQLIWGNLKGLFSVVVSTMSDVVNSHPEKSF